MTILLAGGGTGGHVFPLIAVADALRALAPEVPLAFVGTERGIETKVVPARGYELELMKVLPLRGTGAAGIVRGALRAAGLVPEAFSLLQRRRVRAVFSVGGYAAGPISLAARLRGLPLALLEPNAVMGLANWITAPMVDRAYLAFAEAEPAFPPARILRSGVPIRAGFTPQPYALGSGGLRILVLGGSQGAKSLNEAVPVALGRLGSGFSVVHQCGPAHLAAATQAYTEAGLAAVATVIPFIEDMPAALAAADLVIGRSGASAVSEICAVGRPSVLLPYPFAAGDHQRINALALERAGAASCIEASVATPQAIAEVVGPLLRERGRLTTMASSAQRLGRPEAARTIAADLLALAGISVDSSYREAS